MCSTNTIIRNAIYSTGKPNQIFIFRGDSSDVNCWEALAEAYMARGSFTAAQKSFEKVLQLDSNSVYARYFLHQL